MNASLILSDGRYDTAFFERSAALLAHSGISLSNILSCPDSGESITIPYIEASRLIADVQQMIASMLDMSALISDALESASNMEAYIRMRGMEDDYQGYWTKELLNPKK